MGYLKNYKTWCRLVEQTETTETSKYGEYTFNQLFPDNMITPRPESYLPIIKQMAADLKKAITDGKKLSDIKIKIESSASSQNPTRKVPEGYTKLDHNYGGGAPSNEFLAKNRGESMKKVVLAELAKIGIIVPEQNIEVVPRPDGKWVATSADESEQYVKVKIEGLFEKIIIPQPTITTPIYKYSIVYSWYQIGDSDKKYVLVNNPLSFKTQYTPEEIKYRNLDHGQVSILNKFNEAVTNSPDDITFAGYGYIAPEGIEFFAFGEISNYSSIDGNIFYYADEESWKKDALLIDKLNPTQWTVQSGDLQKSNTKLPIEIHAKGYWNLGKGAQANFEHGTGNFNRSIYTLKPATSDPKKDKKGNLYYSEVNIKQWNGGKTKAKIPASTREAQ